MVRAHRHAPGAGQRAPAARDAPGRRHRLPPAQARRPGGPLPRVRRRQGPPPLRLPARWRVVDERRAARAPRRLRSARPPPPSQDLPDRPARRRHARRAARRLRLRRNRGDLPAGAPAGRAAARPALPPVRRQRRQLPLPAVGRGVRQPGRASDPRPPLPAGRQGQDRTLLPHRPGPVPGAPGRGRHALAGHAQRQTGRVAGRRVPPESAPRPGRAHAAGPVGLDGGKRAPRRSAPGPRPALPLPLRAPGEQGSHRQPAHRALRGRRRAGRGEGDPAAGPGRAAGTCPGRAA